jgi:DNA-3-methyladenine glycosylase II
LNTQFTYTLKPAPPYRFHYLLERVKTSSNSYLYTFEESRLSRSHIIAGNPVLVHVCVEEGDRPDAPVIILHVEGTERQSIADQAAAMWRHMLSVDRPLLPFYERVQDDPVMRDITERLAGMHLFVDSGPFESMVLAIIGQQVNLTFAENLKRSLVELCGMKFETGEGKTFYAFPTPEAIAALNYEDLRPFKFSQRKSEYIIDFARGVTDGSIDLSALEGMSNEEAIQSLTRIRGIGRWTAECVLLFGLGRPDLLPAADIGLRNALQFFYALDHQPTEQEVRDFATRWSGYESYATYYLWTALGLARAEQKQQKLTAN